MSLINLNELSIENFSPRTFSLITYNKEIQHIQNAINGLINNINYISTTIKSWQLATEEPTIEEVGINEVWLHAE